jgi:acyl transferase domain-containing protein/NADPH:quinone reductase-like Zn-dependent oxidoreductase/NAD(P)-dependent dehydrogenase (short-subunit alcohol dehydrogenase family)/acyl carrier protein
MENADFKLSAVLRMYNKRSNEPVAIIGIGCRFPGGIASLDELSRALFNGADLVTEVPNNRFDTQFFVHPDRNAPGKSCTFSAGIVGDLKQFDAAFFGFSPKEAQALDPQQRMVLEMAWEAFEDAGIPPGSWAGSKTAVYVGAASTDMAMIHSDDVKKASPYSMTGTSLSIISNRLSYFFDLHGPSMTIDTACSSSLVALHEACQAIRHNEAEQAIVGGVNVLLSPLPFIGFSKARMLSEDGRCKVFDSHGNGYVRSEGGAVVLLKPLSEAQKNNDKIYALIRATGVNSDGRTQGIALPNGEAQQALLEEIYNRESLDKDCLCYIEAHGTGTSVGDPIEVNSIGRVLGRPDSPVPVGSVKGNLGHLETGSGMAGLAKTLIVFEHRKIPANINCQELNPSIPFKELGVTVPLHNIPLTCAPDKKALIGLNSFGFGGTNAHVVLEEAPAEPGAHVTIGECNSDFCGNSQNLLPTLLLSAQSKESLKRLAGSYAKLLVNKSEDFYTTIVNQNLIQRTLFSERLAVTGQSVSEVVRYLNIFSQGKDTSGYLVAQRENTVRGKTAFVFSGNGCQWSGMGRELLDLPVFAKVIDDIDNILSSLSGFSVKKELLKNEQQWDLSATENAQILLFALQVGIFKVLESRGIRAEGTIGHSVGEVAAAYAAGILTLDDAVKVIYQRSYHQGKTRGSGTMAAVRLNEQRFLEIISNDIEIAGWNTYQDFTVSGSTEAITAFEQKVKGEKGLFVRLPLDYAFHSSRMDGIRNGIIEDLRPVCPRPSSVPFYSTVTGNIENRLDANYWWRNIRETVRFRDGYRCMLEDNYTNFIEVGAHTILSGYLKSEAKKLNKQVFVSGLLKKKEGKEEFLRHLLSIEAAFPCISSDRKQSVSLPHYEWNKKEFWPAPTAEGGNLFGGGAEHPFLGRRQVLKPTLWQSEIDLTRLPWLADHQIRNETLFPAALFIENAVTAAQKIYSDKTFEILNVVITRPLVLKEKPTMILRTEVEESILTMASKEVVAFDDWNEHLRARIVESALLPPERAPRSFTEERSINIDSLYERIEALGYHYGASFRTLKSLRSVGGEHFEADLDFVDHPQAESLSIVPGVLDGAFHALIAIASERLESPALFLPAWFGKIRFFAKGLPTAATINLTHLTSCGLAADIVYFSCHGKPLLELRDVRFRRAVAGYEKPVSEFLREQWVLTPPSAGELLQPEEGKNIFENLFPKLNLNCRIEREKEIRPILNYYAAVTLYEAVLLKDEPALAQCLFTESFNLENEEWTEFLAELLTDLGFARKTEDGLYIVPTRDDIPSSQVLWSSLVSHYGDFWPVLSDASLFTKSFSQLVDGTSEITSLLGKDVSPKLTLASDRLVSDFILTHLISELEGKNSTPSSDSVFPQLKKSRVGILFYDKPCVSSELLQKLSSIADLTLYLFSQKVYERSKISIKEKLGIKIANWPPVENKTSGDPMQLLSENLDLLWIADTHPFDIPTERAILQATEQLKNGAILIFATPEGSDFENVVYGSKNGWWTSVGGQSVSPFYGRSAWKQAISKAGMEIIGVSEESESAPFTLWIAKKQASDELHSAINGQLFPSSSLDTQVFALCCDNWSPDTSEVSSGTLAVNLSAKPVSSKGEISEILSAGGSLIFLMPFLNDASTDYSRSALDVVKFLAERDKQGMNSVTSILFIAQRHSVFEPNVSIEGLRGLLRTACNEIRSTSFSLWECDTAPSSLDLLRSFLTNAEKPRLYCEARISNGKFWTLETQPCQITNELSCNKNKYFNLLSFTSQGKLEKLAWKAVPQLPLQSGEVRVAVKATGLNFRDVMWTMGMLPEEALEDGFAGATLGLECSGIVTEAADGSSFTVGDKVLGFGPACFASQLVTNENSLARIPPALSFEEAATLPVAFFTAWYALSYCARARRGERILIHGAAGGVGIAAIQCAHLLGLEVFATAGSKAKRSFLESLGVKHIYDSRSLEFAERISLDTYGRGVNIVLNSLAGAAAEKSLELLAPFGRFLEIGKRDFYADSSMHLRLFRKNLSYFGIDVDQLLISDPGLAHDLFAELMEFFEQGSLRPLPFLTFEARDAVEAFKTMQASHHIGKIVVRNPEDVCIKNSAAFDIKQLPIRPGRTYVITGGTSGIGFALSQKLLNEGADSLLLISRSGVVDSDKSLLLSEWRNLGREIDLLSLDISRDEAEEILLKTLKNKSPLGGVLHAAGIIEDGMIADTSLASFERVWNVKVKGAAVCDRVARRLVQTDDSFFWFAGLSSATVLIGNPGQANYVAANAALAAIFDARRRDGLPATLIALGAVEGTGMLSRNPDSQRMLLSHFGVGTITVDNIWCALGLMYHHDIPYSHFVGLDWQKISKLPTFNSCRFSRMRRMLPEKAQQSGNILDAVADLDASAAKVRLADFITSEIARLMGVAKDEIPASKKISELGMDSLLVVELGSSLEEQLGRKIPSNALSASSTAESLASALYSSMFTEANQDETLEVMAKQQGVSLNDRLLRTLKNDRSDNNLNNKQNAVAVDFTVSAVSAEKKFVPSDEFEDKFKFVTTASGGCHKEIHTGDFS